ncbi:hypothetical protein SS50377_26928 [Spironucleus salmonicida]|uniref:Uncharacterized protein n=1 Tax=Spironucleus salmonicida TaxID=348837 RepID=S5UK90_9EUKA|nr:hypothetical protein SS50377_12424 [Spironucleus salmonicida]KAH0570642.1 hypothetical protein SS50377_26928 [Spironucleus salmonicida]|eukprot:EST47439.1 Hypothetical protein SS50377_12424 [Spironucleus salmonicida]
MDSFVEFTNQFKLLSATAEQLQIENTELKQHLTAALATVEQLRISKEKDIDLIKDLQEKLMFNEKNNSWLQGLIFLIFVIAVLLVAYLIFNS